MLQALFGFEEENGQFLCFCSTFSAKSSTSKISVVFVLRDIPLDEGVVIKFSSDVSVYSDPSSVLKQADQLLFPEDEAHLSKIGASRAVDWGLVGAFQALQSQLFLRKYVKNLSKKVSSLTFSNSKIKKELDEARSSEVRAKEAMKESVAGLEEEAARLKASLKSSEDKLSQIDERLAEVMERLDEVADEVVIETRGKLMHEYLYGVTESWNPDKDIKIWEKWKALKELEVDDEEAGEKKGNEAASGLEKETVGSHAGDNLGDDQ
ncbi:hypothetical protein EZV62_014187 [Acer yangbiense]|uniref:Uncharacterized protein n=1 Tax=Acer yangbiense TaxID=1000413 RepID=A0A5C7HRU9_9ROSI|nr:hypothetical protein EZV62_014187 [Acer yangbiense]